MLRNAKEIRKKEETRIAINSIKESVFFDKIEYINNHIGIITLMFTVLISVVSFLIKGIYFSYNCGKYGYFGLNSMYIDNSMDNLLNNILLSVAVTTIYLVFNSVPYFIIMSKMSKKLKFLWVFIVIIVTAAFFIIFANVDYFLRIKTIPDFRRFNLSAFDELCIMFLWYSILIYLLGIICAVVHLGSKIKKVDRGKSKTYFHQVFSIQTIVCTTIILSLYMTIAYYSGRMDAYQQTQYKLIDNDYVVIYEDAAKIVVFKYEEDIKKNQITIDTTTQKLMSKENIETHLQEFTTVKIKKR